MMMMVVVVQKVVRKVVQKVVGTHFSKVVIR